jgi:hypothetical protein
MIEAFLSGGVMMWPILAVGVGTVWLAVRTALRIRGGPSDPGDVARGLQALLFWGVMAVVMGVLGMATGIVLMAQAVWAAGDVHAPLLWGGLSVALIPLLFSLLVFLFAALAWFLLRGWAERVGEPVSARPAT